AVWIKTDNKNVNDVDQKPYPAASPTRRSGDHAIPTLEGEVHIIIIIIDSMTSVFNTDASLPYNHDLFESLIVKKRIKMDGEGTYCCLTTIIPRCLHLQTLIQAIWIETDNKIATDI
ncbi:hypothetical protein CSKR_106538, partial [Clonorchis sinensis]